ncbi:MAG: aldose 1-epimerase family protein [Clostridia bacterium]|nr:aldose 1-epimerase family protein [Clostridia bacterium]
MIYTLKNDIITAKISDKGAEIVSVIRNGDGCEYIWQGDEKYWTGQAPYLFPICGRLYRGQYTFEGKTYEMKGHGFARRLVFTLVSKSETSVALALSANADTKAVYPFDFKLTITHTLKENALNTDVFIENTGDKILPAAFGAHPGFNVPLDKNGIFEDYFLEFAEECSPNELILTSDGLNTGRKKALYLDGGKKLSLKRELFDTDALFMESEASSVTLKSDKSERAVTVRYPDLPYLGLWQTAKSDAPFVCIEPWYGLPSFCDEADDMATRSNMYRIIPRSSKQIHMELVFH